MNLNKQQIDSLTNKFYNELKDKYDEKVELEKSKQLEKFRPDYEKGIKLLKDNKFLYSITISVNNKKGKIKELTLNLKDTFEYFTSTLAFNSLLDLPKKEFSISDIKNDIIVATIEANNVNEIMRILSKKYN